MSNTEIKYAIRCDTLEQADECRPYSAFTMDSTGEFMKQEWYTIITYEEAKDMNLLNKEIEYKQIDWYEKLNMKKNHLNWKYALYLIFMYSSTYITYTIK